MKILITGGAGFIGQHFARRIVADGHELSRAQVAPARAASALLSEMPKDVLETLFITAIGIIAILASVLGEAEVLLITLGVFVAAGSRIIPSAVRVLAAFSGIKSARAPLVHLTTTMRQLQDSIAAKAAERRSGSEPTGDIVLTDVRFAYDQRPEADVLRGIDLVIPTGQSLAIVGGSGAGKPTLVDVLLGLLKPTAGYVTAGGIDVRHNLPAWQAQLAVVPQDVYLMDASLARNITFEDDIDEGTLADTIRRAQLSDLVQALPDGVETSVASAAPAFPVVNGSGWGSPGRSTGSRGTCSSTRRRVPWTTRPRAASPRRSMHSPATSP